MLVRCRHTIWVWSYVHTFSRQLDHEDKYASLIRLLLMTTTTYTLSMVCVLVL